MPLHRGALDLDQRTGRTTKHGVHDAARDIRDVGRDRGGRRLAARARSDEGERTDRVAVDRNGVEHAHRLRQRLGLAHHGRMHTLLDAVFGALGDAEQLDAIAKFVSGLKIGEGYLFDAFNRHGARIDSRPKGERGEDREFVRRVEAADVKGRISLGIAEPLGFSEADREG